MRTASSLPLVFVLGDSISIQYGPFLERYLSGTCRYAQKSGESAALADLDVPVGANGGDSGMVLRYLGLRVAEATFRPDLLLLNCGLHDIKRDPETKSIQVTPAEYRENLRQISSLLGDADIPLAWIRTTPVVDVIHNQRPTMAFHRFASDWEVFNAIADEVMHDACVPVIDLATFTRSLGDDESLYCDHVHFQENVRQLQGSFLAGWITAYLVQREA